MTRLPINFLLYLTSIGLAGGCAWTFYRTMDRSSRVSNKEIYTRADERINRGRGQTPDDKRDDYSDPAKPWWLTFKDANFIGKLPEVVDNSAVEQEAPVEKPVSMTPIEEILDVVFIAYSSAGDSRCAVRYKPTANVQPPANVLPRAAGGAAGAPGYSGPGDVRTPQQPRGRGVRQGRPIPSPQASQIPSFAGGDEGLVHILSIGDPLWPTYEHIRLERVDERGSSVYFRRETPGGEGPVSDQDERVFRNELGLTKEVMEALVEGGVEVTGLKPRESEGSSTAATPRAGNNSWIDVPETKKVKGQWHISKADNEMLSRDAQTVFNRDVNLKSYTSASGKVRGIQVTKISPRLERFGVQAGDVIIELNGQATKTKAQALRLGKQQYKTGVRTFRAKVLTRYGNIEERVYNAPE